MTKPTEHGQADGHTHGHAHGHAPIQAEGHGRLPKIKRPTLILVAATAVGILLVLFVFGFVVRHARIRQREEMSAQIRQQPLVVATIRATAGAKTFALTLPADIRAYASTALYARTNGYLASWTRDINDRVKKGDLMAVISAPDADANLEQAKSGLRQQQTTYSLAVATDERYQGLIPTQGVTQEQLDQFRSAREQAQANVAAAAATVDRLQTLVDFERITAPFDGVVTARNYDDGALISASNIAPGQELFDVAEDDWLRVFVNVPQAYAPLIRYNQPVRLALERNFPGHRFLGWVRRSAAVLDPVTRTLRTELDFQNNDPAGHILPGMYGEAIFSIERATPVLIIPTSALLFEAEGREVAVVTSENKIHLQKIVPGDDYGTEMEVTSGLTGEENIVANPGEQIAEGVAVSPSPGGAGASGGAQP